MGIFGSPQDQVDLDDLKSRVARLEQAVVQLQAVIASAGGGVPHGAPTASAAATGDTEVGDGWLAEVRALKADGNVIKAIKIYREQTGVGLKEAKDAVDALI